ncbi:hypothetical protein ACWG0P_04045 [Amedibacillus sp. YH-ame6]
MKIIKYFIVLCTILFCLPFMGINLSDSIHAQDSVEADTETERFLKWYEEHKDFDKNYEMFELKEDIYLDGGTIEQPIQFNGTSKSMYIDANNHTIYIRSFVEIDHDGLTFYSSSSEPTNPTMVVTQEAQLTLKQGAIQGGTSALRVDSGQLICPESKKEGSFVNNEDAYRFRLWGFRNVIDIRTENVVLKNLSICVQGNEENADVLAIQATQNITIQDSYIFAEIDPQYGIHNSQATAIHAGNRITLSNTQIIAKGSDAKSVVSSVGVEHIIADTTTSIFPAIDLPVKYDDIYRLQTILSPDTMNVPIHMNSNQWVLPKTIRCKLRYLYDEHKEAEEVELAVTWNVEHIEEYLDFYGEFTITGSFSQEELASKHIYKANSLNPTLKVKVVRADLMDTISFSEINADATVANVKVFMYRPYGATSLVLQYSNDGIHWVDGYCIREQDQEKDTNLLRSSERLSEKLITHVYFSELKHGGYIRSVIVGGPFEGTWKANKLTIDNLFSEIDGGGGNRGGGGQNETGRDKPEQEEDSTQQESVVKETALNKVKKEVTHKNISQDETNTIVNTKRVSKTDEMTSSILWEGFVVTLLAIAGFLVWKYKKIKQQ